MVSDRALVVRPGDNLLHILIQTESETGERMQSTDTLISPLSLAHWSHLPKTVIIRAFNDAVSINQRAHNTVS